MRQAKIKISLRIRSVWSESSLGAFWIAKFEKFLQANDEDSDQTVRMSRLNFVGRTCQRVRVLTFHWYLFIYLFIYSLCNTIMCLLFVTVSELISSLAQRENLSLYEIYCIYRFNHKYSDTSPYHTCSKIWTSTIYNSLLCRKMLDEWQTM